MPAWFLPMAKFACCLRASPSESPARWAKRILDAGFEGIGLGHPFHASHWEEVRPLLPRERIDSVELFLPYPPGHPLGEPCPFHLDSSHPEEKADAVKYGTETILFADESSIPFIVIPPLNLEGDLGGALRAEVDELPRNKRFGERVSRIQARRAPDAKHALDSFRSVLSKLLDTADRYSVRLAIVPGGFIDQAPSLAETRVLLKEFSGGPLCVWLDTLSYFVASDLGPIDAALFDELKRRFVGAALRDFSPKKEPVLLGTGRADWESLRPLLEAMPLWLADPPETTAEGALEQSLELFEKLTRGPEVKLKPGFYLS